MEPNGLDGVEKIPADIKLVDGEPVWLAAVRIQEEMNRRRQMEIAYEDAERQFGLEDPPEDWWDQILADRYDGEEDDTCWLSEEEQDEYDGPYEWADEPDWRRH